MLIHEIIIEIVRAELILSLRDAIRKEMRAEYQNTVGRWPRTLSYISVTKAVTEAFENSRKDFQLARHLVSGNQWNWVIFSNPPKSNCVAEPRDKTNIRVEVKSSGLFCLTIINGKETEYSAKNRKEILRFVQTRGKLFKGYDLHFTGDATPETVTVGNTYKGRTTKKILEATPQQRIAPEILEIAFKIETWANKNGIDANAILNGSIPATPETIMQAVISESAFLGTKTSNVAHSVAETLKPVTNGSQEVETDSLESWARGYVAALIESHPNRAKKLQKSLEWQLTQIGTVAPELWQNRAKMSFDKKV